ncbi:MAG TPA: DUF883 C-terminal domain-containing protein [Candidatus Udaeobacter sp.]|nr:DUF883 C-terminal domain-containing protein [Candidatus Udaeobacter sp.]
MADDLTKEVPAGMSHVEEQSLPAAADLPQASVDPRPVAAPVQERRHGDPEQVSGDTDSRSRTLRENADRYVRENPARAVFTALGIGFLCGLIFRR